MSFSKISFTNAGRALQAKALAGTPLVFTKIALGSGSLNGRDPATFTSLLELKVSLSISKTTRDGQQVMLEANFSNQDNNTGFYWREVGLFANDPTLGEILYCYGNAGNLAEYIQPSTSSSIEKVITLTAVVGNAQNVTAIINTAAFATKKDISAMTMSLSEVNSKLAQIAHNPKNFGAKCDGVTDDTSAYQAALNQAKQQGGGYVLVPIGFSVVSSLVIPTLCGIIGNGKGSVLKQKANSTAPVISLETDSTKFVTLKSFSIDGNRKNQTSELAKGVVLTTNVTDTYDKTFSTNDPRFIVEDVYVFETKGNGFELNGRGACQIVGLEVVHCDGHGIVVDSFDSYFERLDIGSCRKDGIHHKGNNCRYVNCKTWNNGGTNPIDGYGFYFVDTEGLQLVGCETQSNANDGFYFKSCRMVSGAGLNSELNGYQSDTFGIVGSSGYTFDNSWWNNINGTARNTSAQHFQDYAIKLINASVDNIINVTSKEINTNVISDASNLARNNIITLIDNNSRIVNSNYTTLGIGRAATLSSSQFLNYADLDKSAQGSLFQNVTTDTTANKKMMVVSLIDKTGVLSQIDVNIAANLNAQAVIVYTNGKPIQFNNMVKTPNIWSSDHFMIGNYHLWVDSTGRLRIKSSTPTGDMDGTVVGSQT